MYPAFYHKNTTENWDVAALRIKYMICVRNYGIDI